MIRIGIICPSEIAFRRFLPALQKASCHFTYVGVAIARPEEWFSDLSNVPEERILEQQFNEMAKATSFGGKVFKGYETIIESTEIDALYIPLPPALHYKWARLALLNGKHVLVEKPLTCFLKDTEDLISIAAERELALHENYMFIFHKQIEELEEIVKRNDTIGVPRLYRLSFGFPRRCLTDFRYNKKLGGGALLDAGGYTLKYAGVLLGETARLTAAQVNYDPDFDVDVFGSATMVNEDGLTAQLAFGIDNDYRCDIEVWGSKGTLTSGRILTAPVGYTPTYTIKQNQEFTTYEFSKDDAFYKSLLVFAECIDNAKTRKDNYEILRKQSKYVQDFRDLSQLD